MQLFNICIQISVGRTEGMEGRGRDPSLLPPKLDGPKSASMYYAGHLYAGP